MKKTAKSKKPVKRPTKTRKGATATKRAPKPMRSARPINRAMALESTRRTDPLVECLLPSGEIEFVTRDKCAADHGTVIETT